MPFAVPNESVVLACVSGKRPTIPVSEPGYATDPSYDGLLHQGGGGSDLRAVVSVPLSSASIIERCWAHHPDDRPEFSQVVIALEVAAMGLQVRFDALAQRCMWTWWLSVPAKQLRCCLL